jgi:hypothetical protein
MKSYKLIHELISLVEELEQQNPDRAVTMQDFAGFMVHTAGKSAPGAAPPVSIALHVGSYSPQLPVPRFVVLST